MRKAEQWMALGDKLPVELARRFTPGPWKHEHHLAISKKEFAKYGRGCATNNAYPKWVCFKCSQVVELKSDRYEDRQLPTAREIEDGCSVPDPIAIDWNTAKYWQGKCDEYAFRQAAIELFSVLYPEKRHAWPWVAVWLARLHKPEDAKYVLIIAAMAMESKQCTK